MNSLFQSVAQIMQKYQGQRIKVGRNEKKDQFFVRKDKLHYIDMGAAEVCEKYKLPYKTLDDDEEFILLQVERGDDYNALQMEAALKDMGMSIPKEDAKSSSTIIIQANHDVNIGGDVVGGNKTTTNDLHIR